MNFHRYYLPGAAVFITQVVQEREPVFRNPQTVELLRAMLQTVRSIHPFNMLAYVFLPDHFHILISTGRG